ncbi:glycosyltransferase [Alphaproteobacteria bacterium]|nr:glycosyltransferase [Alphaproteobacteria bacterium]
MVEQPFVCICIPTFNAAETVREMLLSILSQTYQNLVVHISDNASTDNTLEIVQSLSDSRVHIHRNEINVGGEGNFKRCIGLAEGKYTAIFHADDLYEPQMVEKQVAFLERHTEAGAVFTAAKMIDETGKKIGQIRFPSGLGSFNRLYDFDTIFKAVLLHSNFLVCPSVMAKTSVYKQSIQSWRGDLFKSSADLDVWFRMARVHPIGLLPLPLMQYRVDDNQFSAKVRSQTERADFFLVTEYYLEEQEVQDILDSTDLENYERLDRQNRVLRAVNCFLSAKPVDAKTLLDDFFTYRAWKAGMQTKRGFGVLIAGLYMRVLLFFGLEKTGRFTLRYLKRVMRK